MYYHTPIGKIFIESSEKGVKTLIFIDMIDNHVDTKEMTSHQIFFNKHILYHTDNEYSEKASTQDGVSKLCEMTSQCITQLEEYFAGRRKEFDLPLDLIGSEFQKHVWAELLKIPFGQAITYKELAIRVGNVNAIRAAGTANGANPVSIIVPCHRVIGSDGSLTGYAGGLWRKQWLLEFESKNQVLF